MIFILLLTVFFTSETMPFRILRTNTVKAFYAYLSKPIKSTALALKWFTTNRITTHFKYPTNSGRIWFGIII